MEEINVPLYKNPEADIEDRIKDLLPRMNLEHKVAQLNCLLAAGGVVPDKEQMRNGIGQISALFAGQTANDNARCMDEIQRFLLEETELGIPAMIHAEALSGAVLAEGTNYPVAIGLGATWDAEKIGKMGDVIRKQMRSVGVNQAFVPVLDVARDLRWGRVGETYGESPTLTAKLGVSYVKAVQGADPAAGVAATSKHFLGFAMGQGGLNMASASITPRELREVYAKPFEAAIREADLATVMNTYSAIDNDPVVCSKGILTGLLRDELGFNGVTVSDYGSIEKITDVFRLAETYTEAGIQAFTAGMDQELPAAVCYNADFCEAIRQGKVDMAYLDTVVSRILRLKFKLGLFDNPYSNAEMITSAYHQPEDIALSYQLACESMVLLKNEKNLLPLNPACGKIAVIGPNADNLRNLFGGYTYAAFMEMCLEVAASSEATSSMQGVSSESMDEAVQATMSIPPFDVILPMLYPASKTVLQAIQGKVSDENVCYAKGCELMGGDRSGFAEAVAAAKGADVVIMVLGGKNGSGTNCTVGENLDSTSIDLPGLQGDLLREVHATGKPIILVHMDVRPVCSAWIAENIPVIVEAWFPGQCGGEAIADVLFGSAYPSGKLPFTSIRSAGLIPAYCEHKNGSGYADRGVFGQHRLEGGYINESAKPLFCFGHGLSYTSFELSGLEISEKEIPADGTVEITCTVANTGERTGDEVVQLYFSDRFASMTRPNKELAGFQRITLQPGEAKQVTFQLSASQTALLSKDMKWTIEAGDIDLMVGTASDHTPLQGSFRIANTVVLPSSERAYYASSFVV